MVFNKNIRHTIVGVRGAAVGNVGIPTYVISRGAVVRQPLEVLGIHLDHILVEFCLEAQYTVRAKVGLPNTTLTRF